MVAIVAGNGLGLFNTSLNTLGGAGSLGLGLLGQSGGRAIVNAANGNLVLQFQDEALSGRGNDLLHLRTYNSQGQWNDGDADGWRWDAERKLALSGALNTVGSTLTRTTGDGHQAVYTWNATLSRYVSTSGSGAHDSIVYNASSVEFIWTDGSSRLEERYAGSSKLLKNQTDSSGNRISYTYDAAGRLTTVTDDSGKQKLELVYATVPGTTLTRLRSVNTYALVEVTGGRATNTLQAVPTQQVAYGYDTYGRLVSVSTDLTPQITTDNKLYVTTYSYAESDGSNKLIARITQSDGSRVDFTYDGSGRVLTVHDAQGLQTFTYGVTDPVTQTASTHITLAGVQDAGARTWTYTYDAVTRQLKKIESPPPREGAARLVTKYEYNAAGDVTKVIDARGFAVQYEYDVHGNRVLERDALGNTITRTYNAQNQVVTETRYARRDEDGEGTVYAPGEALTSRFVYDAQSRLRFVVSAEGRVTEHRYGTLTQGYGLIARSIRYAANRYEIGGLDPTAPISEADLIGWVGDQDKRQVEQVQFEYDLRGNLARRVGYASVNAAGEGVLDAAASVTEYIYSAHGQLVQTLAMRGSTRTDKVLQTSYSYDGMGRETERTDRNGTRTTLYHEGTGAIEVTTSAGLTELRSFDERGRLITITQSASAGGSVRATQYAYDDAGRLRMVSDAQGKQRFSFYDDAGRLLQQVDSQGAVVGYEYNANGQMTKQTRYWTAATDMAGWVQNGHVIKHSLNVTPDARDRHTTFCYDAAGRLETQIDGAGAVTRTAYDGASRITSLRNGDRVTRYHYDRDGQQVGVVDALGYLTELKYDGVGRTVETVRYGERTPGRVDEPPVWNGVTNRSAVGLRAFEYRLPPAYDVDSKDVSYQVVNASLPAWLTFDASTRTLRGTPPAGIADYELTLEAIAGTRSTSVTLTISVGNTAPSWDPPAVLIVPADAAYSRVLPAASDPESSTLQYSILTPDLLPLGIEFNPDGPQGPALIGTPSGAGSYSFILRVSDGTLTTDRTITLHVTNNAPHWPSFTVPVAPVDNAYSFIVPAAQDPQSLTYRVVAKPAWLSFDPLSRTLSGTPSVLGDHEIKIEAVDAIGEVRELAFVVKVTNTAPSWADLPMPPEQFAGSPYQYLPPQAVDAESPASALTYTAQGLPTGLYVDSTSGRIYGTTNAVGSFAVTMRVADPHGEVVTRTVTLRLKNAPPVYHHGIPDREFDAQWGVGAYVYFTIAADAFYDPNGDALSPMVIEGKPLWLEYDAATRSFSGHVSNLDVLSYITVRVSDSNGATAARVFTLRINNGAPPPPPGTDPQSIPSETKSAATVPGAPRMESLEPIEDPLSALRPGGGEQLHSYAYYDAQGRLVGAADEQGFLTEYRYDEQANKQQTLRYMTVLTVSKDDTLDSLRGRAGTDLRTTSVEYDELGRVYRSIAMDGTVSSNEYDAAGRLVRQVRAEGTPEARGSRVSYNVFGEVTGTVGGVGDASGLSTDAAIRQYGQRYEYDSLGRRIRAIDAQGNTTLYYYDSAGRVTHTIQVVHRPVGTPPTLQRLGEVSEMQYSVFGEVERVHRLAARLSTTVMDALLANGGGGEVTQYLQDRVAEIKSEAADELTQHDYDLRGLLASTIDAQGYQTSFAYTEHGQLERQIRTILKAAGASAGRTTTTRFDYDLLGQQNVVTLDEGGLNHATRAVYDAFGRVVRRIDGAGATTQMYYHDGGRRIEVVDALNRSVTTRNDALGRVWEVRRHLAGPNGGTDQVTVYRYNDAERTVSVTTPEGVTIKTTQTAHGEVRSVEDGRGFTKSYEYTKDGQLKKTTDELGKSAENTYDNGGRLFEVRDTRGVLTRFEYDDLNRIVKRTVDPVSPYGLNLTTSYEFDALGRQITVTEGSGNGSAAQRVTSYEYDRNGRLLHSEVDPQGLKLLTSFAYDGLGNTVRVEGGTRAQPAQRVTEYEFDALGRRVKEIVAPGIGPATERNLTTEYRYDAAGRVSRTLDALGQSTWFVYDAAGQLTHTINALGEVSRSWYDESGRITHTRRYANRFDEQQLAALGDTVSTVPVVASASDARSYRVYDADGRMRYTAQAVKGNEWIVAETLYDNNGNVTETRRYDQYVTQIVLESHDTLDSPGISVTEMKSALLALGYDANVESTLSTTVRTRYAYDAANRLRFTVDALGAVSEVVYDDAGQVVTRVRYAQIPSPSGYSETALHDAVDRTHAGNQVSHFAYDAAGRLTYSARVLESDAQGNATRHFVTRQDYDELGRLVCTTAYAEPVGALANYLEATFAGATQGAIGSNPDNRVSGFAYDAAGRQLFAVRRLATSQHLVTRQAYNAFGQVTHSTAYATAVGALVDFAKATIENALQPSSQDRTAQFVYDETGRQRFTIAADGALSETLYDALGRVSERRAFDLRVDNNPAWTLEGLMNRRAARAVGDGEMLTRGMTYTYDAAGRVRTQVDAKGYSEVFTYNALGDRIQYQNKAGAIWTYEFDRLGRQELETAPEVDVRLPLPNQTGTVRRSLQTVHGYDALGNLRSTTQRYALSITEEQTTWESRVTSCEYDKLGRRTLTVSPGWYDPTTGRVEKDAGVSGSGRFQRTHESTYTVFGEPERSRVSTGAATYADSYQRYDRLGRLTHDVDVLGRVTVFSYNEFDEQRTVTRHSRTMIGTPTAPSGWTVAQIAAQMNGDTQARVITTSYDALGRKTEVTNPSSNGYYTAASGPGKNADSVTGVTASARTTYEYTTFGQVQRESVQLDTLGENGHWRDTWHYYDVVGRETRTIDALGHHTQRGYDALGNLTEVVEYAQAGPRGTATLLPPASPAPHSDDRITAYRYDARNQQTHVVRKGLRYSVLQNGQYVQVNKARHEETVVSSMTHDAEGRVQTSTDALGNVTTNEYNALGQLTAAIQPQRRVAGNGVDPFRNQVMASAVVSYTVDGFGQVVEQSSGAVSGSQRASVNQYDHGGNLIGRIDARGKLTSIEVDYAGRVRRQSQVISQSLDGWRTMQHTIDRRMQYDAAGQQISTLQLFTEGGVAQQSGELCKYNAFGECTDKYRLWGNASTAVQDLNSTKVASYEFDQAGLLRTQTTASGTVQFFYLLSGEISREELRERGSTSGTPQRITETHYDELGRGLLQRQPAFAAVRARHGGSAESITAYATQSFDRWGNVLSRGQGGYVVNGSGANIQSDIAITEYRYNADNQVILTRSAAAAATRANGTTYQGRVSHEVNYDVAGRQVQEVDWTDDLSTAADDRTFLRRRSREYNEVGQLTAQVDATNVRTEYVYDVHGNRIGTRDAYGTVYVDTFDDNGNVTARSVLRQFGVGAYDSYNLSHTAQARQLTEHLYDEANRRIASAEVMDVNGTQKLWTYSQLDERDQVLATRNASGIVVQYGYDAFGHRTREEDGNGQLRQWEFTLAHGVDYISGQLQSLKFGWRLADGSVQDVRTTTYGYDTLGQMLNEQYYVYGALQGQRSYQYHGNGLVKQVDDLEERGIQGWAGGVDYSKTLQSVQYDYTINGERSRQSQTLQRWYDAPVYEFEPGNPTDGTADRYRLVDIRVEGGSQVTSDTRMTYDALGRLDQVKTFDGQNTARAQLQELTYRYDELGNRRQISASYQVPGQSARASDDWYSYDAEGRIKIVQGELRQGQIRLAEYDKDSIEITYDSVGRRASAKHYLGGRDGYDGDINAYVHWEEFREERYSYNDQNLLVKIEQQVSRTGHRVDNNDPLGPDSSDWYTTQTRTYDARGNMLTSDQSDDVIFTGVRDGQLRIPQLKSTSIQAYREDGKLIHQSTTDARDSTRSSVIDHYIYDAAGNLESYQYHQGGGGNTLERFTNTYGYTFNHDFDGYLEQQVEVQTTRPGFSTSFTDSYYNSRGQLIVQSVQEGGANISRTFTYDGEDRILSKSEQVRIGNNDPQPSKRQDYVYVEGREVASLGTLSKNQFSNPYAPISEAAGTTARSYVTRSGDTLASIAQQVYGDSQLWYLIADANNLSLSAEDALPTSEIGKSYRIPQVVTSGNHAGSFTPYDASRIIGDSTPVPGLPASPSQCGMAGQLLAVAVIAAVGIAATVYTGGVFSSAMMAAWGNTSLAAATLGGALGAAAGSAATQISGNVLGVQEGFSGKRFITNTLAGGLAGLAAGGVTSYLQTQAGPITSSALSDTGATVLGGVRGFLSSQAANLLTGSPTGSFGDSMLNLAMQTGLNASGAFAGLDSQDFQWSSAFNDLAVQALHPVNGWAFNPSSTSWRDIAQQSVSAFTSAAVSGVIDYRRRSAFEVEQQAAMQRKFTVRQQQADFAGSVEIVQADIESGEIDLESGQFYDPQQIESDGDVILDVDADREFVVAAGDDPTFIGLAEEYLHDRRLGYFLADYNGIGTRSLRSGQSVRIPRPEFIDSDVAAALLRAGLASDAAAIARARADLGSGTYDPAAVYSAAIYQDLQRREFDLDGFVAGGRATLVREAGETAQSAAPACIPPAQESSGKQCKFYVYDSTATKKMPALWKASAFGLAMARPNAYVIPSGDGLSEALSRVFSTYASEDCDCTAEVQFISHGSSANGMYITRSGEEITSSDFAIPGLKEFGDGPTSMPGYQEWSSNLSGEQRRLVLLRRTLCGPESEIYYRSCEAFQGPTGKEFAKASAEFWRSTVVGHTQQIALTQPGKKVLEACQEPYWSDSDGVGEQAAKKPTMSAEYKPEK